MDSKVIKPYQFCLERFRAVLTEINSEFRSRPTTFLKKKQIFTGLLVTKFTKA